MSWPNGRPNSPPVEIPAVLDTLAAAYAGGGRFADAVRTAEAALALAVAQGKRSFAETVRARLTLYQAGSPYREIGQFAPSATHPEAAH